nr:PEGA domain-containing protein [uncultured Methanoregula sp.]
MLFACVTPCVSAFTISSFTVNPSGTQTAGTAMTVTSKIDFPLSGSTTFPSSDNLQLTTNLENPQWTYTIILDGIENPRPSVTGQTLSLTGFELSYKSGVAESVRVTLTGTIPTNPSSSQNLLKVVEYDSSNTIISSTVYAQTMPVATTSPTPTPTPSVGSISVSSTPSGANVYVDNEYKGLTPVTLTNIANGNRVVLVRLTGYQDWSQSVSVLGNSNSLSSTLLATTTTTTTSTATAPTTAVTTAQPTTIVTTIQTTVPTTEITTIPITTKSTPTKKPTTKKTLTPIPTSTPTQAPVGVEVALLAVCVSGLLLVKRR